MSTCIHTPGLPHIHSLNSGYLRKPPFVCGYVESPGYFSEHLSRFSMALAIDCGASAKERGAKRLWALLSVQAVGKVGECIQQNILDLINDRS